MYWYAMIGPLSRAGPGQSSPLNSAFPKTAGAPQWAVCGVTRLRWGFPAAQFLKLARNYLTSDWAPGYLEPQNTTYASHPWKQLQLSYFPG